MTDPEGTAAKRRVDIAFLQCFDATVFAEPVLLTDTEEQRLRAPLASLQDFGLILQPNPAARRQHYDFDALLGHLGASVGAPMVDAALAAWPGRAAQRRARAGRGDADLVLRAGGRRPR